MRASAHWGQVDPFSMYNGTADGSDVATCCRSRDKWRLRMKLVRVCVTGFPGISRKTKRFSEGGENYLKFKSIFKL